LPQLAIDILLSAGVPFCPLPAAHPDPSHQKALLEHLQSLFPKVIVVTDVAGRAHTSDLVPSLKAIMFGDLLTTAATLNVASKTPYRPSPSDAVALMLTSGSTGKPKAVMLRHSTVLSSCRGKAATNGTSYKTPLFNWIAFDHVASLTEIHIHALLIDAPYVSHSMMQRTYLFYRQSIPYFFRSHRAQAVPAARAV
jgi:long-subunit acyl-CoA synthetase (AMP-forming)